MKKRVVELRRLVAAGARQDRRRHPRVGASPVHPQTCASPSGAEQTNSPLRIAVAFYRLRIDAPSGIIGHSIRISAHRACAETLASIIGSAPTATQQWQAQRPRRPALP